MREWATLARAEETDQRSNQGTEERKIPLLNWDIENEPQSVYDENDKEYLLVSSRTLEQEEVWQLLANHADIQKAWEGMDSHGWLEIHLKDIVTGSQVQPTGKVTFILGYPEGTHRDFMFTIVHVKGGNQPAVLIENIDYIRKAEGFEVTVDSFSPFIVSWKEVAEQEEAAQSIETGEKSEQPQPAEGTKKEGSPMWIVGVLILLIAAAASGYWYVRKNKENKN